MNPVISKHERHGWPSQPLPEPRDRMPEPWSFELLVGVNHVRHHALSPDGSQIAFIWDREGRSDLWLMPVQGARWPRRLTFDRPAKADWTDLQPQWSPDGKALTYVSEDEIWLVTLDGKRPKRLTDHGHESTSPIFSPDGTRVYFVTKREIYNNLCATTPDGDWPIALTRFEADVSSPRPSPDGKTLAFVYQSSDDLNRSEICTIAANGGELRHLTGAAQVWDLNPRWSPDGASLGFLSNRSGWRELYLLDPASGETACLTNDKADVQGFEWSPDGSRIVYVVNHDGAADLHLLTVATRENRPLRAAGGWHSFPQWSPDGAWLTVDFDSPVRPPDIWRVDAASGEAVPLTNSVPPALEAAHLVTPEVLRYKSNGSTIPAFLFRPPSATAANPCPAIVYPHGGPTSEYALDWDLLAQWLVAKGYAVLAPNYRGSTGYGLDHQHALHDRWGIVDTEDMLAAGDYLRGLDWVDGARLGILGFSYGSYLALLALARDPSPNARFRCGVSAFGDCDILTSWAQGDRIGREDLERQMAHPSKNRAGYFAGSPVYDVAKIRHPLLIFHGDEDERVHPLQSEELVEALKRADKTFEYVVYGGEGHGFLQEGNQLHFHATLQRFLDWYLM